MTGILLLDEIGKNGVFNLGSERSKRFMAGKKVTLLPITKRRLEVIDGVKR